MGAFESMKILKQYFRKKKSEWSNSRSKRSLLSETFGLFARGLVGIHKFILYKTRQISKENKQGIASLGILRIED